MINATPHDVTVMAADGDLVHFAKSNVPPIRCTQMYGATNPSMEGCLVMQAGVYTVDLDTIDVEKYKDAETIIVSTIVAADAARIRYHLRKPELRIIVPDSGPSAKRTEKGQIEYVIQFLEY